MEMFQFFFFTLKRYDNCYFQLFPSSGNSNFRGRGHCMMRTNASELLQFPRFPFPDMKNVQRSRFVFLDWYRKSLAVQHTVARVTSILLFVMTYYQFLFVNILTVTCYIAFLQTIRKSLQNNDDSRCSRIYTSVIVSFPTVLNTCRSKTIVHLKKREHYGSSITVNSQLHFMIYPTELKLKESTENAPSVYFRTCLCA